MEWLEEMGVKNMALIKGLNTFKLIITLQTLLLKQIKQKNSDDT